MASVAAATLAERSEAAFRGHAPSAWALVERASGASSRAVEAAGRVVNVDLGGTMLYPGPAPEWTAAQVEGYFRDPDRIGFADPAHCNLSPVSKALLGEVRDYFAARPDTVFADHPVVDVGFVFVFGIGLGYHLPELVARDLGRHLILIEPHPELVRHSLGAIDWEAVFTDAAARGIQIHFLIGREPEETVGAIEHLIFRRGQTFLEGSHAYVHYPAWQIVEARALLNERIKTYYLSRGYFEDELLMMRNAFANLTRWPWHLVERRSYMAQEVPVLIVGSGPSLDRDLPHIKRLAERALVFSCGTSIGILLKNGIRPHLHLENENTPQLVNNLRDFHREFGFGGVILVASATVNPEVASFFDRRWFYFRSHLSSTRLLSRGTRPLEGAAPLVANAAFAVMATTGFSDIHLFGVDCGRREDAGHHARDAVYYQDGYDNYLDGESFDLLEAEFTRRVPANFGGEALTTWYLDMSRVSFTAMQALARVNLVNCSDGARIDGAKPRAAAALEFSGAPGRQAVAVSLVERQLKAYDPGEFLAGLDIGGYADACGRFVDSFSAMVEDAKAEDGGFWEFERRIEDFRRRHATDLVAPLVIAGGSLSSMVRLGAFAGNRLADASERRAFIRFFMDRYRDAAAEMAHRSAEMLAEMAAGGR